ncbi:MAG: ATP-binding cassette domain-containing protein [Anaerolineales bacterium]
MAILKELRQTKNPHARAIHRSDKPILEINNLSVRYESGLALDQVGFQLNHGERVALVGPNGAGKSTLFKVIAGILEPGSG